LRHALVEVWKAWDATRSSAPPQVVVAMGSASRPRLVEHLAAGMGKITGLPVATRLPGHRARASGRGRDELGPAPRRGVEPVRARAAGGGGRPLGAAGRRPHGHRLDLTVAARTLRRAGATAVHPLVLAAER
jgi:ATP-dependent DNA helicase RecQ